jgi:hypothetical protein
VLYENIVDLPPTCFKRAVGVSRLLFSEILDILRAVQTRMGRPPILSLENQFLVCMAYYREYRTQFHIAQTFAVSEATVHRIIVKIENTLIRSGKYRLPSKRDLNSAEVHFELVLVDASETPCERPKKNKVSSTVEKRSAILSRHKLLQII